MTIGTLERQLCSVSVYQVEMPLKYKTEQTVLKVVRLEIWDFIHQFKMQIPSQVW
jgi:hypothetical protein